MIYITHTIRINEKTTATSCTDIDPAPRTCTKPQNSGNIHRHNNVRSGRCRSNDKHRQTRLRRLPTTDIQRSSKRSSSIRTEIQHTQRTAGRQRQPLVPIEPHRSSLHGRNLHRPTLRLEIFNTRIHRRRIHRMGQNPQQAPRHLGRTCRSRHRHRMRPADNIPLLTRAQTDTDALHVSRTRSRPARNDAILRTAKKKPPSAPIPAIA